MNNKLILDLTVRLTQALDQNYDVVNMDTVLAVLSALEGATITKEQLETTRLAKHINQLRRRNKSNILAIRAKNLLKTWREMVGITSQAQSEVAAPANQHVLSTQQQTPKPPLSSSSQPTSPYTTQLLGENLDNSLSSIGGGVEFSRTATGGVINTGSVNFAWSKKSSLAVGEGGGVISSRSNGALTDTQMRLMKSSNRSTKSSNSPSLPGTTSKVKHPTSFKNLLTGFNANSVSNKQTNPSALSPKHKILMSSIEREEPSLKTNSTTFIIDDDDNQSQPSTTAVVQTGVSSPRTHKSTKRKERDSPDTMVFIEQSNSPIPFENMVVVNSQVARNANSNQIVTSTIDLPDSNSSSTFVNALCESTNVATRNGATSGSTSNSNTRIRKDKQKHSNERIEQATESEQFQPNIDESSRIAFPISGIQEYLSLSNSSMSIFPSQQTAGSGGTERYPAKMGSNDDNQHLNSSTERSTEVVDGDLTFAGKFKQNNNSCGIEVGSTGNYFSNGKEHSTLIATEFPCSNMKVVENNCRDSLSAGGTASTSTFLPFSRNSNDSTSNSRASQLDLIDVVNQDSQSMITVDDLRLQQQSSNQKNKNKDVESAQDTQQVKYTKETSNKSKQLSKEQSKPVAVQKPINTSSKPSTPTPSPNLIPTNTLSPNATEQKVPKKRGRKKGSKGVDSVLAQMSGLSSQFLVSPALGSSKKVKTTMELLADIQNRKLGSATSSPTLMNWLGTSRPASSCSEPSLHSPRTSDACSTNATISTAARSTPEKNISNNSVAADELYESDSDSNTSEPSHDSVKVSICIKDSVSKSIEGDGDGVNATATPTSTIEAQIKELMAQLPPVNTENIDWEAYKDVPCTCTIHEVQPETVVEIDSAAMAIENGLELLKDVETIKSKDDDDRQDDDEPIISVNVLPPAPHQQQQSSSSKPWSLTPASTAALRPLSAPVSTVTSPVVPSINQRPMKSIFDLDFDDDNDPLHSFVEAATKTGNSKDSPLSTENGRIKHNEEGSKQNSTLDNEHHSDVIKTETQQSETTQQSSSIESASYQYPPVALESNESIMPPLTNFPTYEIVEDPNCQAKERYDTQTNQITQFHINAFHNCFIPNVNGNWDHSVPQNIDDESHHMENDSLYANVVPKYGCFVTERIPKDLSHVKFTKNFKPKHTDKSDKPPPPFLGVANIHRRQHFRLHHHHNHHRKYHKKTAGQRRRHKKLACVKTEAEQTIETGIKREILEDNDQQEREKEEVNVLPYIPEHNGSAPNVTENEVTEIKENIFTDEHRLSPTHVPEISQMITHNTNLNNYNDKSYQKQCAVNNHTDNNIADVDFFPVVSDMDQSKCENSEQPDESHSDRKSEAVDMKRPLVNGTIHHLMNNNNILHGTTETRRDDVINSTKPAIHNNNHGLLIDGKDDEIAASRRSSSCSNSSLKQNQNSINMKLRRHRLALRQAEMQKRHRKRKNLSSFNDVFEFEMEDDEQPKDPPPIKRIKIVNGGLPGGRRMTNSITDSSCMEEDGDSDCYHVNSENDIITEEEIDEDEAPKEMDEEEDYEEIVDDYDEEDGDDEEEPEEDYGDFREVVTRDMTSSTTGNNHIVLTIKKTPSKTNSPSSSSMSPAPIMNVNVKQPSISPTVDALLLGENAIQHSGDTTEQEYQDVDKLDLTHKLMEIGSIKAEDLIGKAEFFLPEPSNVAIYSFELKKNGDIEHENSGNDDNEENDRPQDDVEAPQEIAEADANAETTDATEGTENSEKKESAPKVPEINSKDFKIITKAKLSESILTTRRELRRLELKRRLREGIEEAQKMHRQLFFPYELHTSIGSKILEINSCTSGCTDPSDYETDSDSSDSDTSSSTDDEDALFRVQKRKRTQLPPKRRRTAGGGGSDPSSSSSSSDSSDSNSSSSSYSAFTSWTTSSEDEDKKVPLPDKREEENEDQLPSSNVNDTESDRELPIENNYLLRSFNHIYVSTEERRRQQQLKDAAEYRRREIMNAGYITITGDDSKEETAAALIPSLASSDNCDVYTNYYNNPPYNIYPNSNNSIGISNRNTLLTTKLDVTTNAETSTTAESSASVSGLTAESSDLMEMPSTRELSPAEKSSKMADFLIEQKSRDDEITDENEIPKNVSAMEILKTEESITNVLSNDKSNPISSDNNVESQSKNNNDSSEAVQKIDPNDESMVPQEEYRTGLRQVDEDVDDEDGNNCARTQQFKEWHEVLQLRSYNDELLTVLPYVVIE